PSLAAAGEALLAACPPPQRAGLGLDLAEQLYARTKDGDRRRETALRLLLLSGVVNSPFEAARAGEGGPWAELRLTRAVLAGASQTGASPYGPRRWYGYSLNRAGAPALGDLPFGRSDLALDALGHLLSAAQFSQGSLCDEPLFGAVPNPRRYPLAKYIPRQARGLFDLCILDECQEYATAGSAQEKAAHRLVDLPGVPTISLSGSLINGYSSSLFANMWALSRAFRADFPRDGKSDFVSRFGFRKRLVLLNPDLNRQTRVAAYGSRSDREEIIESEAIRQMGEAPGVLPLFILRHLLPEAILVHKNDLDLNLPPLDEYPVSVEFNQSPEDRRLASQYLDLTGRLLAAIKNDRSTDRAGMLWGAMSELPSYLDLAAEDTGNVADPRGAGRYEIRYPAEAGGDLIAQADPLPAAHRTAKERWLLATVQAELGEDRNVLLFVRHSGREGRLPKRLARLLKEDLGVTAAILEVEKVAAAKRQDWIDQEAIARGRRVLIVNPQAVKTGLNNLVFYATGIFFELDHSAICYRQAVGRLHRIGQTKPVRVYYPVFRDTAQTTARDLLGQKIKASLQTDGLDIESALEAVGAGDESSRGGARAALSLGHEIYNRLSGRPLPPITFTPLAPSAPLGPPPRPAAPPATRSATPDPDWSGPRVQLSLFA
ncbi:MAG TPA: DEAD/DEAH box helicase, partial [Chloroflexota bacterium]|nr:DEAD/DEAH box helicase [Chloroflexota bacterium]